MDGIVTIFTGIIVGNPVVIADVGISVGLIIKILVIVSATVG